MKTRALLLIFIPAILLVCLALFFRIEQYPKKPTISTQPDLASQIIPYLPSDPIIGDKKAAQTIIIFGDFNCAACRNELTILNQLAVQYPRHVKVIWKGLPITNFPPNSSLVQEYAICANQQGKFTTFTTALLNREDFPLITPTDNYLQSISKEVKIDIQELSKCIKNGGGKTALADTAMIADVFHIQTIPTVFLNNKQIEPPATADGWINLLNLPLKPQTRE